MSKLQLLNVFITERLTTAAVEIFGSAEKTLAVYQERLTTAAVEIFVVVEKTIAEVQGENDRLRGLLLDHLGADPQQLTLPADEVPPKQQEWSPRPGQSPRGTGGTQDRRTQRRTQSPHRLQRNRRNSGPVRRKSSFKDLVNPDSSAALSEIIVSIDEDESEELPSGSKRTRGKKGQTSQVCTEAKTTSELKAPLKSHTKQETIQVSFLS
ncbi:hypothetical protein J4Q44_G00129850 [Coregonus suidteri]|uniref:Uncharacterized protein n=1 Tax=Coregonus suidteri TaxID=861788 RepID=A0AAN8QUZ6_9TELE